MKSRKTSHSTHPRRPAFTIVELLISIAIIALLISTAFYALRTARRSASRTGSLNALRQMMTGYINYYEAHNGRLMPGYVDPANIGPNANPINVYARLRSGYELTAADNSAYVWRLAPFMDHAWQTFMADYHSAELMSRFDVEYGKGNASGVYGPGSITNNPLPQMGIALRPSFGLNSIYVGGDTIHPDPNYDPWHPPSSAVERVAAFRVSEVKNPARLIVFGAARADNSRTLPMSSTTWFSATGVDLGFPVLTAPFARFEKATQTASLPMWAFDDSSTEPDQISIVGMVTTGTAGLPIDRLGGRKVPLAQLDGSTVLNDLEDLGPTQDPNHRVDMSRWSPFAVGNY